jgi:hypothetical protein
MCTGASLVDATFAENRHSAPEASETPRWAETSATLEAQTHPHLTIGPAERKPPEGVPQSVRPSGTAAAGGRSVDVAGSWRRKTKAIEASSRQTAKRRETTTTEATRSVGRAARAHYRRNPTWHELPGELPRSKCSGDRGPPLYCRVGRRGWAGRLGSQPS